MAYIINIESPDGDTHVCELKDGAQYLGSSLNCDIVLLDQAIPERHIAIIVTDQVVKVKILDNLSVNFTPKWGKFKAIHMSEGEAIWDISSCVNFSGYVISLFKTNTNKDTVPSSGFSTKVLELLSEKKTHAIAASFIAVALSLFALYYFTWASSEGISPEIPQIDTVHVEIPEPTTPAKDIWTEDRFVEFFNNFNIKYKNLLRTNDEDWTATIFVLDQADATYKLELIDKNSLPLRPTFFIKNQVSRAIDITIRSLNINPEMIDLDEDVVWISGIAPGSAQAERVGNILRRDVSGLRDVHFGSKGEKGTISYNKSSGVKYNISGVFPGRFPYIVLDDKKIYRPGDKLDDETTLITIKEKSYIVQIGGKDLELDLP